MDFYLLPPEINSARIVAGPGAAPMFAASLAWRGLLSSCGLRRLLIVRRSGLSLTLRGRGLQRLRWLPRRRP